MVRVPGPAPDRTLNVPYGSGSTRGRTRDRFVTGQSRMRTAERAGGVELRCDAGVRSISRTSCFLRFVDVASRDVPMLALDWAANDFWAGWVVLRVLEGNEASSAVADLGASFVDRTIRLRRNLHVFGVDIATAPGSRSS